MPSSALVTHLINGCRNQELRRSIAGLTQRPYSASQASYDLGHAGAVDPGGKEGQGQLDSSVVSRFCGNQVRPRKFILAQSLGSFLKAVSTGAVLH